MAKKELTEWDKAFVQGYTCACAATYNQHRCETTVADLLNGNVYLPVDLRMHGVDESDIETLMPVIDEMVRRRLQTK